MHRGCYQRLKKIRERQNSKAERAQHSSSWHHPLKRTWFRRNVRDCQVKVWQRGGGEPHHTEWCPGYGESRNSSMHFGMVSGVSYNTSKRTGELLTLEGSWQFVGHSKTNSNNGKINTGVKKNYIHIPSVFLTGGIRKTLSDQSVPLRNRHVVPSVSL